MVNTGNAKRLTVESGRQDIHAHKKEKNLFRQGLCRVQRDEGRSESQGAVDSGTQTECPTPVLLDSFISSFVHLASAW